MNSSAEDSEFVIDDAVSVDSTEAAETPPDSDALPEDLPPVEPPSAGFIMQLFLVPGLIVAAVIGFWFLFVRMGNSDQDWRSRVAELRSNNEHRRWHGATGLAQLLRADIELGEDGQKLASNPHIATELTDMADELLAAPAEDEELIYQLSFVLTTLGWLGSHEKVLPVLIEATDAKRDTKIRSDAIRSIAVIAGRASEKKQPLDLPDLRDCLLEVSRDQKPLIRQLGAYALGLIPGDEVDQRLRVMVDDGDRNTRVNAALALGRRQMTDGFPVLIDILRSCDEPVDPSRFDGKTETERKAQAVNQEKLNAVSVLNALHALSEIHELLDDSQRVETVAALKTISNEAEYIRIRIKAGETLRLLQADKS